LLAWASASACALNTSGIGPGDAGDGPPDDTADVEVGPRDDGDAPRDDATADEVSARCGDGVPDLEEQCDEGPQNSDTRPNACRTDCRLPHCGDRVLDAGEACDDGNLDDTDGCRNNCSRPGCGDGTVQPGEQCDDANPDDTDVCLSTCRDATCGDMFVRVGHEECDGFARACRAGCGTVGVQSCETCVLGPCVAPAEICNGRDDDCDLQTDEDFPCVAGASVDCTTPCGGPGTGRCSAACELPAGPACVGPAETCNALDDDCDTVTDDGFECVSATTEVCRTGGGATGVRSCDAAACSWSPCCATEELCPTTCGVAPVDDDCDGTTDVGCPPCNDACEGALLLAGTATAPGTLVGATSELTPSCAGDGSAPDVWYTFTLAQRSLVWVDTLGATWDTVLDLRSGPCPGVSRTCTDDSCGGQQTVWFGLLDPGGYHVAVTGFGAAAGAFDLHFQSIAVPGGDPVQITGNGNYDGNTAGAGDDHAGSCGGGGAPDIDFFTAICTPRTIDTTTCFRAETTFDTVIYWLSPDGTELACNDNPVSGCAEPGRSVLPGTGLPVGLSLLVVDGQGGASGRVRTGISHW
jgi:cysteine-rich repeat protein